MTTFDLVSMPSGEVLHVQANKKGKEYLGICPFHTEENPSMSINTTKGTYHCFGCGASGRIADNHNGARAAKPEKIIAEYIYKSQSGTPLFKITRYESKEFIAWRSNASGGWTKGLGGSRRVPYHLPEVLAATGTIFVVEGEKDCETMAKIGLTATTNPFGAKAKWQPEFSEYLIGREVVLLPDNDEPGKDHMKAIAESLLGKAANVKIVELPGLRGGEDVPDWLSHGHKADELTELVGKSEEYKHNVELIKDTPSVPIPGGYYIKARKIQESEVAHSSPCVREIWDWLLMTVNHKAVKYCGTVIERGQTVRTYTDIQEGLSWNVGFRKMTYSRNEIEAALKRLRSMKMITKRKTTRGLVITVINYDFYQTPSNYECHESHTENRTDNRTPTTL